uniref:Acyltransferase 3 domain-containing protein n=1 Tax=Timema genevievae TaxID=629358 RepID=A0A7R9K5G2_TIMGE|nr:unnamed protein product [Timema genevievae]
MAFSIKKTLPELLSVKRGDGNIQCLHGIRTVCTVALYVTHKYMALLVIPYSNRIYLAQISQQPLSMMLRAFINYVHSFLLLSGVLTAYNICQEIKKNGYIDWKRRYLARFIRLTPALMSLVVFYAYIWEHLGNGPMWNKVVKRNADLCKVSMWRNMLYFQNFYPFEEMCATHTHQLALDMQLSLVAPLLVYLLFLSQGWGILLLATLQVISVALRYYSAKSKRGSGEKYPHFGFFGTAAKVSKFIQSLPTSVGDKFHPLYPGEVHLGLSQHKAFYIVQVQRLSQLFRTANMTYGFPSHQVTPYMFGVGLGIPVPRGFITRRNRHATVTALETPNGEVNMGQPLSDKPRRPVEDISQGNSTSRFPYLVYGGWLSATYLIYLSFFSMSEVVSSEYQYDAVKMSIYYALSPVALSLALCWVILACATKNGGWLKYILCWRGLTIFSKISYSVYLTQFLGFFYNVGTTRTSQEFTAFTSVKLKKLADSLRSETSANDIYRTRVVWFEKTTTTQPSATSSCMATPQLNSSVCLNSLCFFTKVSATRTSTIQ